MMSKIIALYLVALAACVAAEERVVGGQNAALGEHPYQVSLRQNGGHFCGGSIISNNWVLTAAHCVPGLAPHQLLVVVGTNTLNSGGVGYTVIQIISHQQYNPNTFHNDIALLQTGQYIQFSNVVKAIPLASRDTAASVPCMLSGWGYLQANGATPNVLQKLVVRSIDYNSCRNAMAQVNQIIPQQLCTYERPGQGACQGDSGGPLVCNGELAGAVSFGVPCAIGAPDVFTRVFSYRNWIRTYAGV